MNNKNSLTIGLVVALQEHNQLLMQNAVNLIEHMEEDEDCDESLPDMHIENSRRIWIFSRYSAFWEKDIPNGCPEFFKESFRVSKTTFPLLVQYLEVLRKRDTKYRKCIPLEKRVAIALYTLGSSSEYRTIGRLFGVSTSSVGNILHEFCKAIIENLSEEYLPLQFLTESRVDECIKGFNNLGFPQCLGAIDGCHIEVKPSAAEAVDHFNYKGWYSVVLFALVDYRFLYVNVGCPGRCNDSQIYSQSRLSKMIESSDLLKQKSKRICATEVPVLLIGDSAFKFASTLTKPNTKTSYSSPWQWTTVTATGE